MIELSNPDSNYKIKIHPKQPIISPSGLWLSAASPDEVSSGSVRPFGLRPGYTAPEDVLACIKFFYNFAVGMAISAVSAWLHLALNPSKVPTQDNSFIRANY